jgi:CheY-like chemotaxis protein
MVLVVDDEAAITTLVRSVLEDEGFEARAAGNGRRALELLRKTPTRLILLDMWMPVMNGWEFAAAYRQTPPPHAPIVVMTAGFDAEQKAAAIQADGLLRKPFELDDLVQMVRRYITR